MQMQTSYVVICVTRADWEAEAAWVKRFEAEVSAAVANGAVLQGGVTVRGNAESVPETMFQAALVPSRVESL